MSLYLHRSQRVEDLVDALARSLRVLTSDDPFEALPIVVGSRGMDRWLRHELATRGGVSANLAFLFPRAAFEGASAWVLSRPRAGDRAPFWESSTTKRSAWSGPRLTAAVIASIRARIDEPACARVRRYLGIARGDVDAREMAFATEVSATIERLVHDRPEHVRRWTRDPDAAGEHAWLACVLSDLRDRFGESDAERLATLAEAEAANTARPLVIFGLSTLRPGDKLRITALARHMEVHLFALTPSSVWWDHIRSRGQSREDLARASAAGDRARVSAILAELEKGNGMLAANGAPSRDLQVWLESVGYDEPAAAPELPRDVSLLGELQRWVDAAGDNPSTTAERWEVAEGDGSFEIHACHGPLRQCEALRDALLRRFAQDETLEPRHVLVMTPDVATYAPLLAAVFARSGAGVPPIPIHVADIGLRATNPVAEVVLSVMQLADERVTASRLLDLLQLAPLRTRFDIAEDDLPDLRSMVIESGMRWGWNAADRARFDQPALDQNTVRFGLERLALGVLMHDEGGTSTVGAGGTLDAAVPFDLSARYRVERFGKLARVCDELEEAASQLRVSDTQAGWRRRIDDIMARFAETTDATAWQKMQVSSALSELLSDDAGDAQPLSRGAVLSLLQGAFEIPRHGDRPASGAVIACALEPMRSVPFRVVAMVGLDDSAFPRPATVAAWDPFAKREYGEDDRRTVDRHLFLEAVLCARDALLLFGTGFEPRRGKEAPMSLVVSELAEIIAGATGRQAGEVAIRHTLQPWDRRLFARHDSRPIDAVWADAANALRAERRVAGAADTMADAPWPEDESPVTALTAEALARALAEPQRELLERRLGLKLAVSAQEIADREPLDHEDALETWTVREKVLGELISHRARAAMSPQSGATAVAASEPLSDLDALENRLRGEGDLPLSAKGRLSLEASRARAQQGYDAFAAEHGSVVPAEGPRTFTVEGITVSDSPCELRSDGISQRAVWVTASGKPGARLELTAWISLLVAVANRAPVAEAVIVGCGDGSGAARLALRAPANPEAAMRHLSELVKVWSELRASPMLLFPSLSRAVALTQTSPENGRDAETAVRELEKNWEGDSHTSGDRQNVWVSALFGHLDIEDLAERAKPIAEHARRVWAPLLEAIVDEKKPTKDASIPAAVDAPRAKTRGRR